MVRIFMITMHTLDIFIIIRVEQDGAPVVVIIGFTPNLPEVLTPIG